MNNERVLAGIVTKFLLNTCRLRPQLSRPAVQAAMCCVEAAAQHPDDEAEAEVNPIPLTTGSVAEFYIEPMLPHIGDIDVMYHLNTELAIPRGHPPPTQLPAEFHSYLQEYEIIDSHLPGYVYLQARYLLRECVDEYIDKTVEYDEEVYHSNVSHDHTSDVHGPALVVSVRSGFLSIDSVMCVRCLLWPSQATDWPTRHRNYGWPDSATIDHVVNNGSDVVGVAHRQCRQHEWMGKHHCDFS